MDDIHALLALLPEYQQKMEAWSVEMNAVYDNRAHAKHYLPQIYARLRNSHLKEEEWQRLSELFQNVVMPRFEDFMNPYLDQLTDAFASATPEERDLTRQLVRQQDFVHKAVQRYETTASQNLIKTRDALWIRRLLAMAAIENGIYLHMYMHGVYTSAFYAYLDPDDDVQKAADWFSEDILPEQGISKREYVRRFKASPEYAQFAAAQLKPEYREWRRANGYTP